MARSVRRAWTVAFGVFMAALSVARSVRAADAPAPASPPAATWAQVAAIFERACAMCHGADRPVHELSLVTHAGVLRGVGGRAVVVPGAPERSELVARLKGERQPAMPYGGDPLPAAEIAAIEAWIRAGAPADAPPPAAPPPDAPAAPAEPAAPPPADGPVADAARPLRWADVRTILRNACVRFHQPKGLRGPAPEGIRFDTYEATIGSARVAVVPGRPDASPLVRAVEGHARKRMPLDGPPWLRAAEIATLARWVRDGARGDDGTPAPQPVGREVRVFGVFDGRAAIDGLPFVADARTRWDDRPSAGATAEVRAIIAADGAWVATRVRARRADARDDDVSSGSDDHGGRGRGRDDGPGDDHGGRGRGRDDGPGDDRGGRDR